MVLYKGLKRKSNVSLVTLAYIFPLEQKSQLTMSNSGFIKFNTKDITTVIHEETANNATKTELEEGLAGVVRSINGSVPDANGNITVKSLPVTEIKANEDLNDFKEFGEYWCNLSQNAATVKNCPTDVAFTLTVRKSSSTQQELREYTGNAVYIRVYRSWEDTWSEWRKQGGVTSVDGNKPDANGNVACIYRSVESLGLSQNTNTIIEVIDAMPYNGSVLFDYINGSNYESFGIPSNGVLKIFRDNGSASAYLNKYGGTTDAWYANIGSETTVETIKWQKIVTTDNLKSTVLDIFFPVGSIYMDATGKINPNTQFGGTWQKIENRFLYGSSSKSVGATGGSETVTLTEAQIPKHSHSRGTMDITGNANFSNGGEGTFTGLLRGNHTEGAFGAELDGERMPVGSKEFGDTYRYLTFKGSNSWSGSTTQTGGGQAHENMPPYLVVAIWKRTA